MALRFVQRVAAKLISVLTQLTTGYSPQGLSEEWLETLGFAGFFRLSVRGTKILGALGKEFGEVDAQFLASVAAAWNGCGFCGYGHAIGGALLHFKATDEVHPLHPVRIEHMLDCTDEESIAYLESLLPGERHASLRHALRRLYELKMGEVEPESPRDELLVAAVWLYTWTTECTITLGLTAEPKDAMPYGHPIGKDQALRRRYEQARARTLEGVEVEAAAT